MALVEHAKKLGSNPISIPQFVCYSGKNSGYSPDGYTSLTLDVESYKELLIGSFVGGGQIKVYGINEAGVQTLFNIYGNGNSMQTGDINKIFNIEQYKKVNIHPWWDTYGGGATHTLTINNIVIS